MAGPFSLENSGVLPQPATRLCLIAERSPRHAVRLTRRFYGCAATQPPYEQALASYLLGYTLLRWERLDEADELLNEAQDRFQTLACNQFVLHTQRALLYLALLRGAGAGLAEQWAALAAAYDDLGDTLSAARARIGEMIQWNVQGHTNQAHKLIAKIQPVFTNQGMDGDQAWLCRVSGVMHASQGSFEIAFNYLDESSTLFAKLNYRTEQVKTWIECAYAHDLCEQPTPALVELERAYYWACRLDLPLRIALCEKNMGWLYTLRGEYEQGIRFSLRAHDRFVIFRRQGSAAECDLNLGNIAYYAGLWELALVSYQRAERVSTDLGFEYMRLICHRNQAMVYRRQGQLEKALQYLEELLPLVEQIGSHIEEAEIIHTIGHVLADMGFAREAIQHFELTRKLFEKLKNNAGVGSSRLACGWLLIQQEHIRQAAQNFQIARTLLADQPIHQWRAIYGLGVCAERQGEFEEAHTHYHAACLIVVRLRQRLANEHASSGLFAQAERLFIDALKLAWRRRDAVVALELAELQRALVLARAVYEERAAVAAAQVDGTLIRHASSQVGDDAQNIRITDKQALHDYFEQRLRNRRLQPLADGDMRLEFDLTKLRDACQQAFPTGWTILVYIPCDDLVLIVSVDLETANIVALSFDKHLQRLLRQATLPDYRLKTYFLEGAATQPTAVDWPTLNELGARLLPAAILERTQPHQRLLIVGGGPFQHLPWAALRIQGSWLVEQVTPHLLPGLLIWQELLKRRPTSNNALVIGAERFGTRAPDLPNVGTTLDLVQRLWPGQVTRLNNVDVDTLRDYSTQGQLRRYGLIHISTHGQLVPTSGLSAHLKFADADLFYDNIVDLDLTGALVVLAACEGAAGEVLPGEEVLGISRAFLAAGARDIIASQWHVYDNLILAFLELLYKGLVTDADAPTALAQAQRQWLNKQTIDADNDTLAPLVWASMCVMGAGTVPQE